jgi:flavin reductase (DIM6/NTAB) family NADH-FMN oxidoreductase RutF
MVAVPIQHRGDEDPLVSADRFRLAFRRLASTVAIVTYVDRSGAPRGMTATSMCALSAEPPSLLVCVDRSTRTHAEMRHVTTFGLDLLAEDQRHIAIHCARRGADKSLHPSWLADDVPPGPVPRLAGVVAHFECQVDAVHPAFSHSIITALIHWVWLGPAERGPLLYRDGRFRNLATE